MIFDYWDTLGRSKSLYYVWKKYRKNERHLCLEAQFFTKLSQNVCLINTHILIYWYAKYNNKLWKALWFYFVFRVFSDIIDEHSCLKYFIYTKLSQIMCPIDLQILICQHAKYDSRLWKVFWRILIYYYMFEKL